RSEEPSPGSPPPSPIPTCRSARSRGPRPPVPRGAARRSPLRSVEADPALAGGADPEHERYRALGEAHVDELACVVGTPQDLRQGLLLGVPSWRVALLQEPKLLDVPIGFGLHVLLPPSRSVVGVTTWGTGRPAHARKDV